MKRDLMEILACPVCKGELALNAEEENEKEVVRGTLTCKQCGEIFPITDTIPDLRPPSLRNGTSADDFEDLDDFDDEEDKPIVPIIVGVVIAVILILVGLRLRSSGKKSKLDSAKALGEAKGKEAKKLAKAGQKHATEALQDVQDNLAGFRDAITSIDLTDLSHLPKDAQKQLARLAKTVDLDDWRKDVEKQLKQARKAVRH